MEQLIYDLDLQENGTYTLQVTIPIKQMKVQQLKGIQLYGWSGFVRIKRPEFQFWYQMVELVEDDVLLYYCSIDGPEVHEEIHEFLETNVLYGAEHAHYEIKSVRHVLCNGGLGAAIAQTKTMLERSS